MVLRAALVAVAVFGGAAGANGMGYVYAYFQGGWPDGGHSGVFMSYSSDGYTFDAMNGGNAVLVPPAAWGDDEDQMRDPSVIYGPDGKFHMVWTTAATEVNRNIGYASSTDLKNWTDVQLVDVWDPADTPNLTHTWAPEIEYNASAGQYEIVFTANPDGGHLFLNSITTTDFVSFTEPEVFYDGGVTVIDGDKTYNPATGTYVMPMEDEVTGQPNDISMATSTTGAPGTWARDDSLTVDIFSQGTEGPSLIQIDGLWHLYFDYYGAGYLGLATSPDLVHWTESSSLATLPDGHHGTVFAAPVDALAFDILPFDVADLVDDDVLDGSDWLVFQTNHLTDISGYSPAQQAARGDLNGDGLNDYDDFLLFKRYYNSYYADIGSSATFESMIASFAVPEPSSLLLVGCLPAALCPLRRPRRAN